jgi:hypothetical protein
LDRRSPPHIRVFGMVDGDWWDVRLASSVRSCVGRPPCRLCHIQFVHKVVHCLQVVAIGPVGGRTHKGGIGRGGGSRVVVGDCQHVVTGQVIGQ